MKKILLLLLLVSTFSLHAQLPDGSVAPDWTATDINGNEWNLYQLLAEGKTVIMEIIATWSGDSWGYHETGALAEFYNQYGPDGTDEAMVFFVEGDDYTDAADLDGTGANTQGNWLENTPYPIIDDAEWLLGLYEAYGYPDILAICPNRLLSEVGQISTFSIFQSTQACLVPLGQNNAGIYTYVGFDGEFCGERTFAPSVIWQNIGTENITSATFELYLNGMLAQTIAWMGELEPYALDPQGFDAVTVTESTVLDIVIASVNGAVDDDDSNNSWQWDVMPGPIINQNFLSIEILTDEYPTEIYWEILNENGVVFYNGGNPGIFDDEILPGTYGDAFSVYTKSLPLPIDGCYEFVIYDQYGDGICCNYGQGYYRLRDDNNVILLQGGLYGFEERRPFSLEGAQTITANAEILNYNGPSGDFCGTLDIQPYITVRNLGSELMTSLDIQVTNLAEEVVQDFSVNTTLPSGQADIFTLDPISLDAFDLLRYRITNVNGQPDTILSGNVELVRHDRRVTNTPALNLEIQTDNWGYEIYWEMRTLTGKVIASGGNELIGPDGGGLRVATIDDPGSYGDNETFNEEIILPDGFNDCYEFLFVDDWGDGLGGSGFLRLTDEMGNVLFNFFPPGTYESRLIDAQLVPSNTVQIPALDEVSLFPNPVGNELQFTFSLSQNADLKVGVFDLLGRQIISAADGNFAAGHHVLSVNAATLPAGVFFLKIMDGEGILMRQFVKG